METKPVIQKKELPKLEELYTNQDLAIKTNKLQILLNQNPAQNWVKEHPIYKNKYIPIEVQEWLLTVIFTKWWVEVKEVKQILNSAVVTIRLFVVDPTTGETIYQDGVGAKDFQLNKDAKADDFSQLKQNAVMLAVPIAESLAFSDAADKFGRLFGKDLNRKNNMNYDTINDKFDRYEKSLD